MRYFAFMRGMQGIHELVRDPQFFHIRQKGPRTHAVVQAVGKPRADEVAGYLCLDHFLHRQNIGHILQRVTL